MKTEEQKVIDELFDRELRESYLLDRISNFKPPKEPANYPDAKKHQIISFIKSGIRIAACFAGGVGYFTVGFFLLGVAEIVGIIEELV